MNVEKYSEQEMVNACVSNNRKMQEFLYRKYFQTMLKMVKRYTDDDDEIMSILNNGFLKVFKNIHTFQFAGSLEGWIRKCVYHAMADFFKVKNRIKYDTVELSPEIEKVNADGEQNLFEYDLLKIVDILPQATKTAFKLYAIDGFTHREISAKLGISEGTSKWHVSEARTKLTKILTNQGINNIAYEK